MHGTGTSSSEKTRSAKVHDGSPSHVLGYDAAGGRGESEQPSRTLFHRRTTWVGIIGGIVLLVIALGVGLGVGLHNSHTNNTSSDPPSNANSTNATSPTNGPATQNYTYIDRSQLWNETQYYLSNSNFQINATPQDRVFNWSEDRRVCLQVDDADLPLFS